MPQVLVQALCFIQNTLLHFSWLASHHLGLNFYLFRKTFYDNHMRIRTSIILYLSNLFILFKTFITDLFGLQLGFCFLFFPTIYLVHQGRDFACLPYSVPRMASGTQQIFNNYMLMCNEQQQRQVLKGMSRGLGTLVQHTIK